MSSLPESTLNELLEKLSPVHEDTRALLAAARVLLDRAEAAKSDVSWRDQVTDGFEPESLPYVDLLPPSAGLALVEVLQRAVLSPDLDRGISAMLRELAWVIIARTAAQEQE